MKVLLRYLILGPVALVLCPLGVFLAWLLNEEDPVGFGKFIVTDLLVLKREGKG